jgi:hypothetical protein
MADAGFLYVSRLIAESQPWYEGKPTGYDDHLAWLAARVDNPLVTLKVWEEDGVASGSVRIDSNGEFAFDAGTNASEMLRVAVAEYAGRLKATVDVGDPKVSLLQRAGFTMYPAVSLIHRP